MDSHSKAPVVYEYLDVTLYLQDYYQFRKTRHKDFSYQFWADELGMNSRSFLRLIVTGKKRITPRFVESFARLNFSSSLEESYFELLVRYSQATSSRERHECSQRMLQILRSEHSVRIVTEKKDFMSDPFLPRLLSLLCFSDVRATAQFCSRLMNVDLDQINEGLYKLLTMNLVEKVSIEGEDVWMAVSDVFHVPDSYGNFDLMKFHEKSLNEAIAAFDKPKELRRYKSLFVPLDEGNLEKFNKSLEDFIAEQLLLYNNKEGLGRYLYQINVNFYPVTERIEELAEHLD